MSNLIIKVCAICGGNILPIGSNPPTEKIYLEQCFGDGTIYNKGCGYCDIGDFSLINEETSCSLLFKFV